MSTDPTSIRGDERMFAHRVGHYKGRLIACLLATVFAVLPLAGCGDDEPDASVATGSGETGSTESTDAPDTEEADAEDLEVIEGWSEALSEGDVEAAATYFATPSTAENGPLRIDIESLKDAVQFNTTLPCGATVVSARTQGELTTATFELSERPGGDCGDGAGGTASTSFDIEDGKIIEWRRIDDGSAPQGGDSAESAPV